MRAAALLCVAGSSKRCRARPEASGDFFRGFFLSPTMGDACTLAIAVMPDSLRLPRNYCRDRLDLVVVAAWLIPAAVVELDLDQQQAFAIHLHLPR
jgi:hypothetical protein